MIIAKNVKKEYYQGERTVHAIRGVNLRINDGDFIAITGPSGSGKSTLMHLLGLIDFPTKGSVVFDGKDTKSLTINEAAETRLKKSGYVFQFFSLLDDLSASENVMIPGLLLGLSRLESKARAEELLSMAGLADRIDHTPTQLSGGELQRVAIARALMNKPKVIFADEPTAALDTRTANAIVGLFSKLNREQGQTVVMVTHEPYLARKAHKAICLRDGKIIRSIEK
ncbi:MAG: ABC transporter ATP-binding protein [Nanoarchaeota archaeon]